MGARRIARERVLQALYARSVGVSDGSDDAGMLVRLRRHFPFDRMTEGSPDQFGVNEDEVYADRLFHGVLAHLDDLDGKIGLAAENWRVDRMDAVDRSLIRMAVYEICYRSEVPAVVSMDEAVDLAKRYGGEGSAAFVNGVLDRVERNLKKRIKKTR